MESSHEWRIYPIKISWTMNKVSVLANPYLIAPALYQSGKLLTPATRSNCKKVVITTSKFLYLLSIKAHLKTPTYIPLMKQ